MTESTLYPGAASRHILILTPRFGGKWEWGGGHVVEQAEIMRKFAGWKIRAMCASTHHFITLKRKGLPIASGIEQKTVGGLEVWHGYYPYYLPRRSANARLHFGEKLFLRYVEKYGKPDFLWVVTIPSAGLLARHLQREYGVPYFLQEHIEGYQRDNFRPPSVCRQIAESVNDAAFCAAVGDGLRGDMLNRLPVAAGKICVIHNPLGLLFEQAAAAPRRRSPFVFISTCILRRGKNVDIIIRAFAEIYKTEKNAKLLLVGGGELMQSLQNLTAELGLSEAVVFAGQQTHEKIYEHLLTADAFVSASEYETFGLTLIEALACGLPAVNTPVGIAPQIINEKSGALVGSPSVELVAGGMRQVMRGDYDSAAIQQKTKEHFSAAAFARAMEKELSLAEAA